jgi:hypothetical protein
MDVQNLCSNVRMDLQPQHVCKPGGCGDCLRLNWKTECAGAYVNQLLLNEHLQQQFQSAVNAGDVDAACAHFQNWIVQAAVSNDVGMARRVSACAGVRALGRPRIHRPSWFNEECMQRKQEYREAVQGEQSRDVCEELRKLYRKTVQRVKRNHMETQRACFLERLRNNDPAAHAMLRPIKRRQPTPLAAAAWQEFLQQHFQQHVMGGLRGKGMGDQ